MKNLDTIRSLQTYIEENGLTQIQLSDQEETVFSLVGGETLSIGPDVTRFLSDHEYLTKKNPSAPCDVATYTVQDVGHWDLTEEDD